MRSVMCKSDLRMEYNILIRVIMKPSVVFLRSHLRSFRSIALLVYGRGKVYGLGDSL